MIEDKEYIEIDINGLSNCLAEDMFKEEVKDKPRSELYEMVVVQGEQLDEVEIVKQIKPMWASTFFLLKERYEELIRQFIKKK